MSEFVYLLIILLAAHVLADFLLQTKADAERKRKKKTILLRHCLVVAALSYAMAGIWEAWEVLVLSGVLHFAIDWCKSVFGADTLTTFLVDQASHILSILLVAVVVLVTRDGFENYWVNIAGGAYVQILILLTGAILVSRTGSIVVEYALAPFLNQMRSPGPPETSDRPAGVTRGFESGGRVIGNLERALIFLFIVMQHFGAVGFLVAAKAVLRFGEVRNPENRMEAEYIIIGTLMSFGYGVFISYLTWLLLMQV